MIASNTIAPRLGSARLGSSRLVSRACCMYPLLSSLTIKPCEHGSDKNENRELVHARRVYLSEEGERVLFATFTSRDLWFPCSYLAICSRDPTPPTSLPFPLPSASSSSSSSSNAAKIVATEGGEYSLGLQSDIAHDHADT